MKTKLDYARFLSELSAKVMGGDSLTLVEAQSILTLSSLEEVVMLLAHATQVRNYFRGNKVSLCAIVNAKSGRCSEDCIFCAQSVYYRTNIPTYPLYETSRILEAAVEAKKSGADHFSIVISGKGVSSEKDLETICEAVTFIGQRLQMRTCASLGILNENQVRMLSEAGLTRYHHNLETSRSHFPRVCTTHSYDDRVNTILLVKEKGLEVCAGGVLGIGETPEQRIELAFMLKDLDVDSVPLNFLHPIPGTPLGNASLLNPLEALKIIALFRLVLPSKEVRVCGGREVTLRSLQPLIYLAGASGIMVGNYLTTIGREPKYDLEEIIDLGLKTEAGEAVLVNPP